MTIAIQASSKNQITITESEEGLLYDVKHDHCYIDPPPTRKKRKLRVIAGPRNNVALASNTFLNLILAFGYSKAEDWRFVEKEMAEDEDQVYNDYM